LALEEAGDLGLLNEAGGQEVGRDEQHGNLGALDGRRDLGAPVITSGDVAVVPDLERAFRLQNAQVLDELDLPVLVLMAVADEDRRAAQWVLRESRRFYRIVSAWIAGSSIGPGGRGVESSPPAPLPPHARPAGRGERGDVERSTPFSPPPLTRAPREAGAADGENVGAAFTPLSRGTGRAAGRGAGGEGFLWTISATSGTILLLLLGVPSPEAPRQAPFRWA
jgi:hypothetical protein